MQLLTTTFFIQKYATNEKYLLPPNYDMILTLSKLILLLVGTHTHSTNIRITQPKINYRNILN